MDFDEQLRDHDGNIPHMAVELWISALIVLLMIGLGALNA